MTSAPPKKLNVEILHLEAKEQLSRFNCGVSQIDSWAKNSAHKLHDRGRHAVYVLREVGGVSVLGFFSLSLTQEKSSKLLSADDRQSWAHGAPFVYLDYIAVLRSMQGYGLGRLMLARAMELTLELCRIAPAYGLALRSLSAQTTEFYCRLGFGLAPGEEAERHPLLVLPIFSIREMTGLDKK